MSLLRPIPLIYSPPQACSLARDNVLPFAIEAKHDGAMKRTPSSRPKMQQDKKKALGERPWSSVRDADPARGSSAAPALPIYSSSLSSSDSLSSFVAFLAGFFFFLFLPFPVFLERGCSRILRTSSSSICLSVLYLVKSSGGGPPSLVMPFFVIAAHLSAHSWKAPWHTVERDSPIVVNSRATGALSLSPTTSY